MKSAKELMLGYINGTAEQSGALFADDGSLELPYLASIGFPPLMTGPRAITDFLTFLHGTLYPGFSFEDVRSTSRLRSRLSPNITSTIGLAFRAKTSNSNSSVTWKPPTAKSNGCERPSTSSSQRKRSIRTASPTSSKTNRKNPRRFTRMASFAVASLVAGMIFISGLFGLLLQRLLPKPHTSDRSRDMISSVVGTTTLLLALVLGLLIWTAYGVYTAQKAGLAIPRVRGPSIRSSPHGIRTGGECSAVRS